MTHTFSVSNYSIVIAECVRGIRIFSVLLSLLLSLLYLADSLSCQVAGTLLGGLLLRSLVLKLAVDVGKGVCGLLQLLLLALGLGLLNSGVRLLRRSLHLRLSVGSVVLLELRCLALCFRSGVRAGVR